MWQICVKIKQMCENGADKFVDSMEINSLGTTDVYSPRKVIPELNQPKMTRFLTCEAQI